MTRRPLLALALLAAAAAALSQRPAAAQAARSLREDPSVRSAGMGGASTADGSDDLNAWANPALLGHTSGLRYRWNNTRFLPDLASDVH
ncbi:MAG: hypothetical protein ACRENJ_01940 [Candidatus Eiseniibacteriota bacterium]